MPADSVSVLEKILAKTPLTPIRCHSPDAVQRHNARNDTGDNKARYRNSSFRPPIIDPKLSQPIR